MGVSVAEKNAKPKEINAGWVVESTYMYVLCNGMTSSLVWNKSEEIKMSIEIYSTLLFIALVVDFFI